MIFFQLFSAILFLLHNWLISLQNTPPPPDALVLQFTLAFILYSVHSYCTEQCTPVLYSVHLYCTMYTRTLYLTLLSSSSLWQSWLAVGPRSLLHSYLIAFKEIIPYTQLLVLCIYSIDDSPSMFTLLRLASCSFCLDTLLRVIIIIISLLITKLSLLMSEYFGVKIILDLIVREWSYVIRNPNFIFISWQTDITISL